MPDSAFFGRYSEFANEAGICKAATISRLLAEQRPEFPLTTTRILPVNIEILDNNAGGVVDTELARTFLTVVATGNFIKAAEHLHVSQSTVSTRINTLEQELGCRLFVRNKAGTALTLAGSQFQRHASTLVRTVEQARHEIGIPRGFRSALTIGSRIGLWEQYLLRWLPLFQKSAPDVSIRAEIGFEAELMQGLVEGRLDIGVMYTPQSRPGLKVEQLFEERLVLVSTDRDGAPEPEPGYVFVDWGPEFHARHSAVFPNFPGPALTANIGWLGLHHVLENGGSGYFPMRLVQTHIQSNRLSVISQAPEFSLPAYAVYVLERNEDILEIALENMRNVARLQQAERLHA